MTEEHYQENRTARTPIALLPYQQRWVADASPVKVCEKSRRIGLSWGEAAEDALLAASESGMDVWYIGYNKDMAREFIEDCADWARFYNLAAGSLEEFVFEDDDEDKHIHAFRITFASGFKVVALSSRPSNLRGKQGKVVIDEAAFHDDLDGLLKAALALLIWGGRVVVISTHDGDENPFNQLVNDIREGKKKFSLHRIDFDEALAEGLYQRICLRLGREWSPEAEQKWRQDTVDFYGDHADEELFCIPSRGAGIYFPGALVKGSMSGEIPVIRWEEKDDFTYQPKLVRHAAALMFYNLEIAPLMKGLSPTHPTWFGEDFARSGDLTVIMPGQEQKDSRIRTICSLELRNIPFEQQRDILFLILDHLPQFRGGAMDSRGNGQYLAEVAAQKYGPDCILQVMITQQWYRDAMPKYHQSLEDRSIILPLDQDIVDDHRLVRMTKGVAQLQDGKHTTGRDGKQRHGDSAIAGCLLQYAVDHVEGGVIEFESTGVGRSGASSSMSNFMGN